MIWCECEVSDGTAKQKCSHCHRWTFNYGRRVMHRGMAATANAGADRWARETPIEDKQGLANLPAIGEAVGTLAKARALPVCDEREYVPVQTAGSWINPVAALHDKR